VQTQTIYDSQGRPIALGGTLGKGGEGEVYGLTGREKLVAKLYHKPPTGERAEKLKEMVCLQTEALIRVAAWPIDTCHRHPGGEIVGLVMPKVLDHREIHNLYSPKSRLGTFPNANWKFLLRSAANLARSFAVVHQHGHLVADVNHGNALVSKEATIRLIDCDSFQVQTGKKLFLCEVGVGTHVPPELQGGSLRVQRTENHDSFGLAVLIFQILFMGRHPYSGHFLGTGDMPIEKAIREHRFAYGPSASMRQMRQPPNTLDLAMVSKPLVGLFENAFSPQASQRGSRPRAQEWIAALEAVKTSTCDRNSAHLFLEGMAVCPWCNLESHSGTIFFYPVFSYTGSSSFDLGAAWASISGVASPGALPPIPDPRSYSISPSAEAFRLSKKKRTLQIAVFLLAVAGISLGIYLGGCMTVVCIALSLSLALAVNSANKPAIDQAKQRLKRSQAMFAHLATAWDQQAKDSSFGVKLGELATLRDEYRALPSLRQRKFAELEAGRKKAQLEAFLDRYRIEAARLSGISSGRVATLQSFGIETAQDIIGHHILQVPGFGPVLTGTLLSWRRSIESRFVFDVTRGVAPADTVALDRSIAARRDQIERSLLTGRSELERIKHQILIRRQAFSQQLEAAAKEVAQLGADAGII
jgi:DNA-binding helix-hairpin-helix protein with protein kinase domain